MQVAHALGDDGGLRAVDKNTHQQRGKHKHQCADRDAEPDGRRKRAPYPLVDAVSLLCAVVLGNKDGERIAEILHRQIGKGINFDRRCKRRHDHRAKAVDQPLHSQDP